MESTNTALVVSRKTFWTGVVVSALPVLFLLMDGVMKLFKPEIVVKTTEELGYSEQVIIPLGIVLLACTILYMANRTAVMGAILLTGYLGGAVATHVRVGSNTFSIVFPVIVGLLLWAGLYLRNARMSELIPFRVHGSEA